MELKVGEWVRTEEGFIFQLMKESYHQFITTTKYDRDKHKNYKGRYIEELKDFYLYLDIDKIKKLKRAFNYKNLIKDGDFVNGYPVREINGKLCNLDLNNMEWTSLEDIDIWEGIVTKEQMEDIQYVIKRDKKKNM